MIDIVRLPLRSFRWAYDINPQISSTRREQARPDRTFGTLALPRMELPMYQHIIGTGGLPYIRLKGRATDFVPHPEGVNPSATNCCSRVGPESGK
jgi:hypothetical protein